MAGIGFVLRKLSKEDNLSGITKAYFHSAMASTGPWLMTVFALGLVMIIGSNFAEKQELFDFRLIIIYNFAFSLVFTGPIYMIATRYLADSIHVKDVTAATGLLITCLAIVNMIQIPISVWFYLVYANLTTAMALSSIVNFMLISTIWVLAVFLSSLKDFKDITGTFFAGLVISTICAASFASGYGAVGVLNGFNVGLVVVAASLMARVFAEYPYPFKNPTIFLSYFRKYWELTLSGLFYNAGVWVDKWIMWFAPEAERTPSKLLLYPNYDSAMFLAYLTIIPSMALFVFSVETNFFEKYLKFYRDIQRQATFERIQSNHAGIIKSIIESSRNFLVLQGIICVSVILLAPRIFDFLGVNYLQIGIFRYGVLGSLFQVLLIFLTILLSYFDNRKAVLKVQMTFFFANTILTIYFMQAGFQYYGLGYCLASILTFVVAAVIVGRYIENLPYHAFITSNTSVGKGTKA
ncbi:MAG: exopolysaccharide Pel transporter PelG [Alphaproteobacteria bacterium]|nr:exopolysaccharide Pel transporter PelG [Alphaproteobacteria bacterium]